MNSLDDLYISISKLLSVRTTAFNKTQQISEWVKEIRSQIIENRKLLEKDDEISKLKIMKIFFRDIIQKGVPGETCLKVQRHLDERIGSFKDLKEDNYKYVMKRSGYRFPKEYYIWGEMVSVIQDVYAWNWKSYIEKAENNYIDNFKNDEFLNIKGVGVNVRNLALSNFSPYFPKIDKHVGKVFNRLDISKLLLGKKLPKSWHKTEKLQPLFVKISNNCSRKYSETDLDRIFWHFGREICSEIPKCNSCVISSHCNYKFAQQDV